MTSAYNPIEIDKLVVILKQLETMGADDAVVINRALLVALVSQLEAAREEIDHLTSRDLFRHPCEWFIATDPEPWRIGRPDFPACENRANCVGETLPRRSQYVLCREHAEQWDGDLVMMSGEAIAIPKRLILDRDTLRMERDAARSDIEGARNLLRATPTETLWQAAERTAHVLHGAL